MGTKEIQELENKLKSLQQEGSDRKRVKQLKKQIKTQQFSQTKTGRFIDVVGGFGSKVGKNLLTPKPVQKGVKKRIKTIKEVMRDLPQ